MASSASSIDQHWEICRLAKVDVAGKVVVRSDDESDDEKEVKGGSTRHI